MGPSRLFMVRRPRYACARDMRMRQTGGAVSFASSYCYDCATDLILPPKWPQEYSESETCSENILKIFPDNDKQWNMAENCKIRGTFWEVAKKGPRIQIILTISNGCRKAYISIYSHTVRAEILKKKVVVLFVMINFSLFCTILSIFHAFSVVLRITNQVITINLWW